MALDDVHSVLLNRVLVRLYEDVATINDQIHQVHADVAYLVQTRQVTSEDAVFILSKVPQATDPQAAVFNVEASLQELAISDIPPSSTPTNALVKQPQVIPNSGPTPYIEPPETRRPVPKIPVAPTFKAQALWEYNVENEHPDDLSFHAGEIIEVDEDSTEQNEDWWYGRVRGRAGLFPRAYVERLVHAVPPPPPPMIRKSSRPPSEVGAIAPSYVPYRSTHVAMNPADGGPNVLGLHAPRNDEAKRAKYDHYKATMANSAASGVGFGAGAALAGGLVRAIF